MATFRVNRAQDVLSGVPGTVGGVDMPVIVPQFEVELIDDTGQNGTLTRRYRGATEIAAAKEKYVPGETVEVD